MYDEARETSKTKVVRTRWWGMGEPMSAKPLEPVRVDAFWSEAIIAFGLSLTAAWMILLGCAVFKLIRLAV